MNKLTKKQSKIIDNVKKALWSDYKLLSNYHDEGNYDSVRRVQRGIEDRLDGISSFIIYSDTDAWDAVKESFYEIIDDHVLSADYARELLPEFQR